jgi:PAS domain S-box-containing protein
MAEGPTLPIFDGDAAGLGVALASVGGPLAPIIDELPVGIALIDQDGTVRSANTAAKRLLGGQYTSHLSQALCSMAERAAAASQPTELVVRLQAAGDIRIVLARMVGQPGYVALLQVSHEARLRDEIGVLRSLLALATEAMPPAEAASRALATLRPSLPGSYLVLYERDEAGTELCCVASVGVPEDHAACLCDQPLADANVSAAVRAAVTGQPVHVASLARSPFASERTVAATPGMAELALPVRVRSQAVGTLLIRGPLEALGTSEFRQLQGLADLVGALCDRSRQEATLAADRAARRSLMDNLADAVVEQGADGTITLAGGRTEAILGRTAEACVGVRLDDLLVPEEHAALSAVLLACPAANNVTRILKVLRPDGSTLPCEVSLHTTTLPEKRTILRAVFRDISERLALEAAFQRAQAAAVSQDRLAALGLLAAGVCHEINNPLAFIKANIDAVGRYAGELEARDDEQLAEIVSDLHDMVGECRDGLDRIAGIVQALRDLSRNRSGESLPFDPAREIQSAVTIFRGATKATCPVTVEVPELPRVLGSPGTLGQVVLNLLTNGFDAMGGKGQLEVRAEDTGTAVRLSVRDHGPGIPSETAPHVFEPFFTTKEVGKGTGLGLHICREIVTHMGGEISFETGPTGTTFVVSLPAAPK